MQKLTIIGGKGLLFRVHGSATPVYTYVNDRPVNEKEPVHVEEKQAIAKKAIAFISEMKPSRAKNQEQSDIQVKSGYDRDIY